MKKPSWLIEAEKMLGTHEVPGLGDNPTVVKLYAEAGHPEVKHDEVAWCAAFVGAMLHRCKLPSTGTLWALDYSAWGQPLPGPAPGAVATKQRRDAKGKVVGGHVFFIAGWDHKSVFALGGNQSDSVSVVAIPRDTVKAYRWPPGVELPGPQPLLLPIAHGQAGSEA